MDLDDSPAIVHDSTNANTLDPDDIGMRVRNICECVDLAIDDDSFPSLRPAFAEKAFRGGEQIFRQLDPLARFLSLIEGFSDEDQSAQFIELILDVDGGSLGHSVIVRS